MSDTTSPAPLGAPVRLDCTLVREAPVEAEALGVGVFSDRLDDEGVDLDWTFLAQQGFEAKVGQTLTLPGADGRACVIVGLGEQDEVDLNAVRHAGAALARASCRYEHLAVTLLAGLSDGIRSVGAAQALAEGLAGAGCSVDPVETNIVFFDAPEGLSTAAFLAGLDGHGVRMGAVAGRVRAVTHLDVDRAGITTAIEAATDVGAAGDG